MPTLNYSIPTPPEHMSLKARMTYAYLFSEHSDWFCARTGSGNWIVSSSDNLLDADVFPDETAFVDWLESATDDNLNNDPEEFLAGLLKHGPVKIDDLFDEELVEAVRERLARAAGSETPTTVEEKPAEAEDELDDEEDD